MRKEQMERIQRMEQLFDTVSMAMKEELVLPGQYDNIRNAVAVLSEYYGSEAWKQDYADDEAGLFPKDLKRGVLSEDGIWNLLSDWKELEERLFVK